MTQFNIGPSGKERERKGERERGREGEEGDRGALQWLSEE